MDKVLLVEDDPIAVMLCKSVIAKQNFARKIDVAADGQKALEYYQTLLDDHLNPECESFPDLILLDLNMPVMGGWEFLDTFLNQYFEYCKNTRVIILSSTIVPEDKDRAGQYDIVVDFLSKPIRKEHLDNMTGYLND